MKSSLLFLGIALVSFTNVCNAKSMGIQSTGPFPIGLFADDSRTVSPKGPVIIAKPSLNEDAEVFNPETIIPLSSKTVKEAIVEGDKIIESAISDDLEYMIYEESMKEIIAQADLVIENSISNETYPLFNERTLEEEIAALETIIESKETNETTPLDFKKINDYSPKVNSFDCKGFVGMH